MAIKVTFATAKVSSGDHDEYGNLVFGEITSDKTPQITDTLPDGSAMFDGYDLVRNGSGEETTYSYRSNQGTFSLKGGQLELLEFDTGTSTGYTNNYKTVHNYVDFPNIAGTNSDPRVPGTMNGIPTRYEPDTPYANVETNSSWSSSGLQAFAGIGYSSDGSHSGTEVRQGESGTYTVIVSVDHVIGDPALGNVDGKYYISNYYTYTPPSGGTTQNLLSLLNIGDKDETDGPALLSVNYTVSDTSYSTNITKIAEKWYPTLSFQNSVRLDTTINGSIVFKVYPDSEYTLSTNMTETTVPVSAITINPSDANGTIATHSAVTVTCSSEHRLADDQNRVIISGSTSPTHINGIHNVHTVDSDTEFTFLLPKSTVQGGESVSNLSNIKLITYDGIDKTGLLLKLTSDGTGAPDAEVLQGGCAGTNTVILRGTPSIQTGKRYYLYTEHNWTNTYSDATEEWTNTATYATENPIGSVVLISGPRYKSLFHSTGLFLDENTGQVSSNGKFNGIHSKGITELDAYYPKFKHARDSALNSTKTDGLITQSDATGEAEGDTITITGGSNLPSAAFFKTITYANGFSANVSYRQSDNTFVVDHNALITEPETYTLKYLNKEYPTPNTSTYWAYNRTKDLGLIDPDKNGGYPALTGTHEMFNTPVHFTIRAMKKSSHLSAAGLPTSTISYPGFGTFENGTNNYVDGKLFIRVYTNTDSDRDDMVKVFVDQNNASRSSDDFNRNDNAFEVNDNPSTNGEFLANNYSNGNFSLINSV